MAEDEKLLNERDAAEECEVAEEHEHCCCGHDHNDHEHHHDHEHHGHEHHHGCDCDDDDDCCCGHEHHHGCDCDDDDDCCCGHEGPAEEHQLAVAPTFSYHVLDVDCPHCALNCQNAVRLLPTVDDAQLIYATSTLNIVKKHGVSDDDCLREVLACVRLCGQDLELTEDEKVRLEAERTWYQENRERVLMLISGVALVAGLVTEHLFGSEPRAIPFYVIAAVAGLVFVAPMAFASLRRRTADMNVLMGIAVLGGLIMGFAGDTSVFGDAAIVIFLDQVGEWLEGWSMRKTSSSIRELMELAPDVAHLVSDGSTVDVEVSRVEEGEHIRILPGERVPLDGVIVSGSTSLNEAAITGESVPRDKAAGDDVFAGSLNVQGVIEIEVTADEDCTTLARVISMVQGAQAEKAPYESFVDRFAAVYTPLVVGAAVVVGIGVPLVVSLVAGFSGQVWHDWVYRALSLLVVACPCALVISTPVSFVSALTRAARMGVLVKGGAYFDIATKVTSVAFDKTGTLTTGSPQVTEVVSFGEATQDGVLALAHALEEASTHPLARAIVSRAHELNIPEVEAENVKEVAANGICGIVDGVTCSVGKPAFAKGFVGEAADEAVAEVERLASTGASALVVTCGPSVVGVIGVADTIRPTTNASMKELLAAANVRSLEMLTGDHAQAASAIAAQAGVTAVSAELLPEGKVERIRDLQAAGEKVAMVGDGINDAPALAAANLGITMGAAASDTALEVADVALLSDDLAQLPAFFRLSVHTMHIVTENIAFAILVKALVFVLVIAGVAGMGAAVFADTGVALSVILNGMRLMLDSRSRW